MSDHLVTRMRLNNGRVIERIPSSYCHAYLGVDPAEVSFQALKYLMGQAGWSGPKTVFIKFGPTNQQIVRGYEREVQA